MENPLGKPEVCALHLRVPLVLWLCPHGAGGQRGAASTALPVPTVTPWDECPEPGYTPQRCP